MLAKHAVKKQYYLTLLILVHIIYKFANCQSSLKHTEAIKEFKQSLVIVRINLEGTKESSQYCCMTRCN